jgi:AAA domain
MARKLKRPGGKVSSSTRAQDVRSNEAESTVNPPRWEAPSESLHYSGHFDTRPTGKSSAKVKRRAETMARFSTGHADDREEFIEEAKGEVRWEAYETWLIRRGWEHIKNYAYPNPEGQTLYETQRYHYRLLPSKKKFVPRHLENNSWVHGPGPVCVPYNLPELLKRPDDDITLVEGEKAVEYLKRKKLLASCVQGQHWTDDVAQFFAGRTVNVVMDNDDSGRQHIETAREWLAKWQATVPVVTLPGLPPRKGLDDWLEAHSVEEYQELVAKTPVAGRINIEPHDFPDEATIEQWDWLYGTHLLRKTVSGTAATSGVGKSSLSIVEVLAMATGKALLGVQPSRPIRVLLINLEDNRNTMNKRIAAAMKLHGLKREDVGDCLVVIAKREYRLKITTQTRIGVIVPDETAINGLINYIVANKIDMVSIDPLRMSHRVNENDNIAIGGVIECYDQIAETADCAIHLWHHTRKSGGAEISVESARGAQAFIDACRSVRIMETMTKRRLRKLELTNSAANSTSARSPAISTSRRQLINPIGMSSRMLRLITLDHCSVIKLES